MSVNREDLKRMIDCIHEDDAAEVYDFIGYLNMKRERERRLDVESLSEDEQLIRQVQKSQKDRKNGHIYDRKQGLKYLHNKIEKFERGQNL